MNVKYKIISFAALGTLFQDQTTTAISAYHKRCGNAQQFCKKVHRRTSSVESSPVCEAAGDLALQALQDVSSSRHPHWVGTTECKHIFQFPSSVVT